MPRAGALAALLFAALLFHTRPARFSPRYQNATPFAARLADSLSDHAPWERVAVSPNMNDNVFFSTYVSPATGQTFVGALNTWIRWDFPRHDVALLSLAYIVSFGMFCVFPASAYDLYSTSSNTGLVLGTVSSKSTATLAATLLPLWQIGHTVAYAIGQRNFWLSFLVAGPMASIITTLGLRHSSDATLSMPGVPPACAALTYASLKGGSTKFKFYNTNVTPLAVLAGVVTINLSVLARKPAAEIGALMVVGIAVGVALYKHDFPNADLADCVERAILG